MVEKQMLQIVLFSVFIGIALITLPTEQAQPLLALLGSLQAVSMRVVGWAMRLAPLAVFGLLARITANLGIDALLGLGVYVLTVLLGLLLLLVVYLVIAAFAGGWSPGAFLRSARDVQLLGFSTSSSAAVMPLSIKTAEEKLGVRPSIAQFMVPLGATINMDGTALYQAVATVFLAQVTGVDLSAGALALIVVTTVGASIGAPSTPGVGIVLLSMVLTNAGIPPQAIGLIIGVDRILDMSRTAVNVTGDLTACLVMDRWVGGERSAEEERRDEQAAQLERERTGADVVIAAAGADAAAPGAE
jgi:Na+/H+-dicarboxylate symporter